MAVFCTDQAEQEWGTPLTCQKNVWRLLSMARSSFLSKAMCELLVFKIKLSIDRPREGVGILVQGLQYTPVQGCRQRTRVNLWPRSRSRE